MAAKENYQSWQVAIDDFAKYTTLQEKLFFFIRFGVLAPSSHNSQPWRFTVRQKNIEIEIEPSRTIPVGDPENRFSRISIGCAITNISLAAEHCGFSTAVEYLPDGTGATLSFAPSSAPPKDYLETILERVTNRGEYSALPNESFLEYLKSITDADLEIHIIDTEPAREAVALLAVDASIAGMEDSAFRKELARHIKNNLTKAKTGIPAFGLGMPTPPSFLAPFLVKRFNMSKTTRTKDLELFRKTPVFCLIASKTDSFQSQIKTGQLYEEIALRAHKENLRVSAWGAPIIAGGYHQRLAKTFSTTGRPQLLFRLGFPVTKDPPHSPRLSAEEVTMFL